VKVFYGEPCRSSGGAYHGAIVVIAIMRVPLSLRVPVCTTCYRSFYMGQAHRSLASNSVYIGAELSYFAAFILLELPPTAADLSRKPVPPPPLWLRYDASVLFFPTTTLA